MHADSLAAARQIAAANILSVLTLLAILLSPIIALQISRKLDERKERKQRKMWIFYNLMATRANRVAPEHVRALNSIDLEFVKDKRVTDTWKAYLDLLSDRSVPKDVWFTRSDDLFVDLLYEMAEVLGFKFDKVHLRRSIYSPEAHGKDAEDLRVIRDALVAIAKGEQALRVDLSEITSTPEEETAAAALRQAWREVLAGTRPVLVRVQGDEPQPRAERDVAPRETGPF